MAGAQVDMPQVETRSGRALEQLTLQLIRPGGQSVLRGQRGVGLQTTDAYKAQVRMRTKSSLGLTTYIKSILGRGRKRLEDLVYFHKN